MSGRVGLREESRAARQLARQIARLFAGVGLRHQQTHRSDVPALRQLGSER
jgi:hypothetical protein